MTIEIKKFLKLLLILLFSLMLSAMAVRLSEFQVVKYGWVFIVFWVSAALIPKFFIQLFTKKNVDGDTLVPILIIIPCAVLFNVGERIVIFGFGVGITFTIGVLLMAYLPVIFERKK